jgi:hypothetical protein
MMRSSNVNNTYLYVGGTKMKHRRKLDEDEEPQKEKWYEDEDEEEYR